MKKVLITVLALAAVACNKAEVVEQNQENAIVFDNAFVDNATKVAYDGSYNTNTLEAFDVYATITRNGKTANIFKQELVKKGNSLGQGTNWSYSSANTQYWVPGNTYKFRAIADGNVANVSEVVAPETDKYMATSINLLDASAQKDILVAEETVSYVSGAHTVKFTFEHILAKVKFTIKNTIATNNGYSYKVSNISMNGIAKNGIYTFGTGWAPATVPATYNLSFGNAVATGTETGAEASDIPYNSSMESNYDRLLIPTAGTFKITFDYQLLKDGIVIDTKTGEDITASNLELEPGHAYNFIFSLGNPGDPIQFDVLTVTDWDENHTGYNPGINM